MSHVVGWLLTGALLMLGAPFWFDLLSRLVSLRNAGKAPPAAAQDPSSATSQRAVVLAGAPARCRCSTWRGTGVGHVLRASRSPVDALAATPERTTTVGRSDGPPDHRRERQADRALTVLTLGLQSS